MFIDESELPLKIMKNNKEQKENLTLIGNLTIEEAFFNQFIKEVSKFVSEEIFKGEEKVSMLTCVPEIHYNELQRASKQKLKFINEMLNLFSRLKRLYKYLVVFVCVKRSDLIEDFGKAHEFKKNVEKRFTRVAISYALSYFTRKYDVNVKAICLDKGGKSEDKFFLKYNIKKIISRSKAKLPDEYISVDSNPCLSEFPEYSLFVDLIDLMLGTFKNSVTHQAKNRNKIIITDKMFDILLNKLYSNLTKGVKLIIHPKKKKTNKLVQKTIDLKEKIIEKIKYYEENTLVKIIKPSCFNNLKPFI